MLLKYPQQPRLLTIWAAWIAAAVDIVAPPLFSAEVTSVLRHHVTRRQITPEEGERAFTASETLKVRIVTYSDLQRRAWELSKRYNQPRAYDSQYLVVATSLACDFWTVDERLANGVGEPWIKLVK